MINTSNTRIPIFCEFTTQFNSKQLLWCSYTHTVKYAEGEKVMYAGASQFRSLLEATDARKNSAWREHVSGSEVIVKVHGMFEHHHEARNHVSVLVREHKPFCNMHGIRNGKGGPVRCIDEDRTFDNAAIAARYYGVSPATLSNHLNRRPGYVTIHGMVFERL